MAPTSSAILETLKNSNNHMNQQTGDNLNLSSKRMFHSSKEPSGRSFFGTNPVLVWLQILESKLADGTKKIQPNQPLNQLTRFQGRGNFELGQMTQSDDLIVTIIIDYSLNSIQDRSIRLSIRNC